MNNENTEFYVRADAHIKIANGHLSAECQPEAASSSFMFASARFNAWVSAFAAKTPQDLQKNRQQDIDFLMEDYRKMLDENFDDYIQNFNDYMKKPGNS